MEICTAIYLWKKRVCYKIFLKITHSTVWRHTNGRVYNNEILKWLAEENI